MRAFLSVDLPNNIIKNILTFQNTLRMPGVKIIPSLQLHITLAFLGELEKEQIDFIIPKLFEINKTKFNLSFENMGYFKRSNTEGVIFINVAENKESIIELNRAIISKLELFQIIKTDTNTFIPHLTIARVKDNKKIWEIIDYEKPLSFGSFTVESFKLKKSTLSKEGPTYQDLAIFPLI